MTDGSADWVVVSDADRRKVECMEKLSRAVVELDAVAAELWSMGDSWSYRRVRDASQFARDIKRVLMEEVRKS